MGIKKAEVVEGGSDGSDSGGSCCWWPSEDRQQPVRYRGVCGGSLRGLRIPAEGDPPYGGQCPRYGYGHDSAGGRAGLCVCSEDGGGAGSRDRDGDIPAGADEPAGAAVSGSVPGGDSSHFPAASRVKTVAGMAAGQWGMPPMASSTTSPAAPGTIYCKKSKIDRKSASSRLAWKAASESHFSLMISLSGLESAVSKSRACFVSWRPAERPVRDFQ